MSIADADSMSEATTASYFEHCPAGPYIRAGIQIRHVETGQLLGEACGKNLREEHSLAELFAAAPETARQRDELLEAAEYMRDAIDGWEIDLKDRYGASRPLVSAMQYTRHKIRTAIERAKGPQS